MQYWLFIIDQAQLDRWRVGERSWGWWTAARRDSRDKLIRRLDKLGAGEPHWEADDEVLVYDPALGRCVGRLRVLADPDWREEHEEWDNRMEVLAVAPSGPTPDALGLELTQGARKRLSAELYEKASSAMRDAAADQRCPACDSTSVAAIAYGLPWPGAEAEADREGYILGGDVVEAGQPGWQCLNCRHQWPSTEPARARIGAGCN